jgi:hypothetical protein
VRAPKTSGESRLSNRAIGCLERLFSSWNYGAEVAATTPKELKLQLLKKTRLPPYEGRSIEHVLLMQKNCGRQTTVEILTWIGMANGFEPHNCVCRHCGRKMLKLVVNLAETDANE